jgi:hypothetical protein
LARKAEQAKRKGRFGDGAFGSLEGLCKAPLVGSHVHIIRCPRLTSRSLTLALSLPLCPCSLAWLSDLLPNPWLSHHQTFPGRNSLNSESGHRSSLAPYPHSPASRLSPLLALSTILDSQISPQASQSSAAHPDAPEPQPTKYLNPTSSQNPQPTSQLPIIGYPQPQTLNPKPSTHIAAAYHRIPSTLNPKS